LALPAEALPNGNRAELRAFSGADGKLLWKRALAPPINQEHVPLPVAADIDGDGKPEVVALDYVEKPASGNRTEIFARLIVLGGTDGAPKSQPWETKVDRSSIPYRYNNPEFLNRPVAVPLAGGPNEPAAIALGFWGSQGEAVVLQHGREEIARFPLRHRERDDGPRSGRWWGRLWNLDVDADGCDELLVVCDQKVRAIRPFSGESAAEAPVWEWSIPAGSDHTTEDEPGISPKGRMADVFDAEIIALLPAAEELPATVAVRYQNRVYGLSAADGSLLWSSAEGSVQAGPQRAPPTMFVLPSGDGPAPHVISTFPDEVTVCRRAIAAASDTLPIPDRAVTSTTALAEDPRLLRPLPWASNLQDVAEIAQLFAWAAMFSVVVIVLPGGLLWRMVKKRRWSLRTMLLLPVVIAIVITVLRTDLPGTPRDWNTAYVKLVYALIILPAVAIAAELIYSVYSGRWRRLACWITASVLFALLAASLTVIVPSQGSIDLGERYAWDGWYLIWFPGAYVTGILVIAERALGTAYRSARQMSGGRPAPDR
ncbi:MAG: hypothetical protein QNM00_08420, partial [Gammaproteobacteria bacterium]|nr:hypothetical protein [Gammaproteobacteria bacterium]